jgi:multicomponent K+:H+ antiporter subunit E
MNRLLPYPLLTASLLVMWILLNDLTVGHLILGSAIALGASWAMTALHPAKLKLRRWDLIPRLIGSVAIDVLRSNFAVASIIVLDRRRERTTGFVVIPLELRNPTALAVLACILTSTPGTAWVEYRAGTGTLLLHVLDLIDEQQWIDLIKGRYERPLMEIFE